MKAVAKEFVALGRFHTTCLRSFKHKKKSADRAEIGAGFKQKPVTIFRHLFMKWTCLPRSNLHWGRMQYIICLPHCKQALWIKITSNSDGKSDGFPIEKDIYICWALLSFVHSFKLCYYIHANLRFFCHRYYLWIKVTI